MSYRIATVDELQDIDYREDTHMRPVRHHLGITAFGTNAWTADNQGDRLSIFIDQREFRRLFPNARRVS